MAPDPYRKTRDLAAAIPRDRRPLVAAAIGSIVGALLATSVTLAWVRGTPIHVDCTDRDRLSAVSTPAVTAPCRLDPASAVLLDRNPLPDVPRYPGAILRTSLGDVAHNTAVVDLETCASLPDVRAFYRATKGVTLDGERSGADEHFFTFTKDDPIDPAYTLVFDVSLARMNDGTRIHLTSSLPRAKKSPPPAPPVRGVPVKDRF